MPASEFAKALPPVLIHEGGYVNDPHDPGGETNQGVTARVYYAFRARRGLAKRSVREMTAIERDMIYKAQYWDRVRGDDLPAGVAYATFDGAVNSGDVQAAKWLQRALGVKDDGHIGEATIAAANAHPDHDKLIADMLALRLAFLKRLKTWPRYGRGWGARVADVKKRAQAWASGSVGPAPARIEGAAAKARVQDAKAAPSPVAGDLAAGAGGAGALIGGAIKAAQDQLAPVASVEWVQPLLAVLAVASVALVLGGVGWRAWQSYRARKHAEALS